MFVAFSSSYQLEAPVPRQPALLRLGPRLVGVREEVEGEGGQDACASDRGGKETPLSSSKKISLFGNPPGIRGRGVGHPGEDLTSFFSGGGEIWP